ncbi:DUF1854 domain-containing protein [Paenibacillus tarimensis]
MSESYDIHYFEPNNVFFSRGKGGVFQGVIEGSLYKELIVFRAFPLVYTTQYISIRDTEGKELGIIRDIDELDEESRTELGKELQFRYFLPEVTRVDSVKQKADLWLWELQTSMGPTRMAMRNLHEHLQFPGGGRIILTDINGRRCDIPDWNALDGHSRKQLTDVI